MLNILIRRGPLGKGNSCFYFCCKSAMTGPQQKRINLLHNSLTWGGYITVSVVAIWARQMSCQSFNALFYNFQRVSIDTCTISYPAIPIFLHHSLCIQLFKKHNILLCDIIVWPWPFSFCQLTLYKASQQLLSVAMTFFFPPSILRL